MRWLILGAACVALAGCGQRHREDANGPASRFAPQAEKADIAAPDKSGPQIAYTYGLSYTLDAADIAPVQARQVVLCRQLGPARCLVVKTDLSRDDASGMTTAQTNLVVDAGLATRLEQQLDAAATGAGGSVSARHVAAEDVTKQVIDTDARVRAKQALANRLFKLIGSANGKVGELVEAEKAFADTQAELEAARGKQGVLRRRVAMSEINIDYAATASRGSLAPVRQAAHDAGGTLASSVANLLTFAVAALPWALALAALVWVARRLGWQLRFWRRREQPR